MRFAFIPSIFLAMACSSVQRKPAQSDLASALSQFEQIDGQVMTERMHLHFVYFNEYKFVCFDERTQTLVEGDEAKSSEFFYKRNAYYGLEPNKKCKLVSH